MTQLMQLVQNQQNHSSEASQVLNFNVLRMYLVFKFFKYSNYYFVNRNDFFMNLLDILICIQGGFGLDQQSPTPYRLQASSHQETSI